MHQSERFGQVEKGTEKIESNAELRDAFGTRVLQAVQEVYSDEVAILEQKISGYEGIKKMGYEILIIAGALNFIAKSFGLEINEVTEFDISEHIKGLSSIAIFVSGLGTGYAFLVENLLRKKLGDLKEKLGVLPEAETQKIK